MLRVGGSAERGLIGSRGGPARHPGECRAEASQHPIPPTGPPTPIPEPFPSPFPGEPPPRPGPDPDPAPSEPPRPPLQ